MLPFQGNSSPHNIWQQRVHLLHEYKLKDKTLQKAQLKQHKILQNFSTNPTPNAPPLPTGTTPKVSPLLEPNNSDNDSPEMFFDKTGDALLNNDNKSLAQTHICKKISTYSLSSITEALWITGFAITSFRHRWFSIFPVLTLLLIIWRLVAI